MPQGTDVVTEELDTRGLKCPIPVLKARKAMKSLDRGQQLLVYATDPGAVQDFAEFCLVAGHHLLESSDEAGVFRFLIQKS
ncbi:MAG: sulfurtransferase TusA family protein [Proteobacteria bacterium]|nr:sulfurtransferase TusA family protein [Pseudomonadota bacterium]